MVQLMVWEKECGYNTPYGLVGKKPEELVGKLFKFIKHKVMKIRTGVVTVETKMKLHERGLLKVRVKEKSKITPKFKLQN